MNRRFTCDYLPTLKPMTQERYRTSFWQLSAVFGDGQPSPLCRIGVLSCTVQGEPPDRVH
jgi:hypothetical protein